jgi:hypothetical protein
MERVKGIDLSWPFLAMTCGMGLRPFMLSRFARWQSRGLGFDSGAFSILDGKWSG